MMLKNKIQGLLAAPFRYYRRISLTWQTLYTQIHALRVLTKLETALQAPLYPLNRTLTASYFLLIMKVPE